MTIRKLSSLFLAAVCVAALLGAGAPSSRAQDAPLAEPAPPRTWTYHDMLIPLNDTDIVLQYALQLPDGFDPAVPHPLLITFAPEQQDEAMVDQALRMYWAEEARRRGWIVVSPTAPLIPGLGEAVTFHTGAEVLAPALIDRMLEEFHVEGGKPHLAGVGRGGASAFQVATFFPDRLLSLTTLSGRPRNEMVLADTRRLQGLPITMYAGQHDIVWHERVELTSKHMNLNGTAHEFVSVPDTGHLLETIKPSEFFDRLDKNRRNRAASSPGAAAASEALTRLHEAASRADGAAYFQLFAPGAVFMGTDAHERWTLDEFKAYANPHFEAGRGWTYVATRRNVTLSDDGATAWFDERLVNARYGVCRGSGVLRKAADGWKIVQYNLSVPIPNDLLPEFAARIRAVDKTPIPVWR